MSSRRMERWTMNLPKFKQIDDMANMTFLNKASVLDNLCQHYTHTRICDLKGQRAIAKQHGVMAGQEPVLTQRASLCCCKLGGYPSLARPVGVSISAGPKNSLSESLENQIIQVNPVLETLDNAKTTRKKNSSHFGSLEKSDVISQEVAERDYRIFHQILSKKKLELTGMALCVCYSLPLMHTPLLDPLFLVAFDVLGSSPEERICVYKLTRGIMHLGTMKFKQKPREEQAEVDNAESARHNVPPVSVSKSEPKRQKYDLSTTSFPLAVLQNPSFRATGLSMSTGWLEKNEDHLNEAVMGLLQKSSMSLLWVLFKEEEAAGRVNMMWYNQYCQLNVLVSRCHWFWCPVLPHHSFVERINPVITTLSSSRDDVHTRFEDFFRVVNNKRTTSNPKQNAAGGTKRQERGCFFVTASNFYRLLYHYTCLSHFRYQRLNPSIISPGFVDNKKASELLLGCTDLGRKEYRIGYNKHAHGFLMRTEYKKMLDRRLGLMAIQRNIQKFLQLLFWGGWKLVVKPLLNVAPQEKKIKRILEDLSDLKCDLEVLETTLAKTEKEKQALDHRVRTLTSDLSAQNDSVTKFQKEKRALEEVHQAEITAPFFFTKLQGEENKVKHLTKNNSKPTTQMHELEDKCEQEREIHGKVEKGNHKAESDFKMTIDIENLNEMNELNLEEVVKKEVSIVTEFLRLTSDAHVHKLEDNLSEANGQLAEVEKSQAEINAIRLQAKNSQPSREHKEAQSRLNQIVHMKISLTSQADDFKRQLDEESKVLGTTNYLQRLLLLSWDMQRLLFCMLSTLDCTAAAVSLANSKHDLASMKELEEEEESKAELQCPVSKLSAEVTIWRTKYKTGATERTRELEETKTKLAVRLQEEEKTDESVQAWVANMKKTRQRLQKVVENLTVDLEKANAACAALEKKQRAIGKMLAERQQKCKELQMEADSSQKEYTTENFELKSAYEESLEHLPMKKENKVLQEEMKDLINQPGEGGKGIHELQEQRLEIEKDELQVALEEAESSLEAEESKLISIQLKLAHVKADTDRRHEKKEFETTRLNLTECCTICFTGLHRNNHHHATESLQASLGTEADAEALRLKTMDAHLTRMEIQLDHANRNDSELVRTLNKLQQSKRMRMLASMRRSCRSSKCFLSRLQTELEEVQTDLEGSEHSRKLLEQAEIMKKTISLLIIKKLEPDLQHTTNEHEEIISEYAADEGAKKATADAEQLALKGEKIPIIVKLQASNSWGEYHLPISFSDPHNCISTLQIPSIIIYSAAPFQIKELEIELDPKQKHHVETKILHKRPLKELVFTKDGHKINYCVKEQLKKTQNKLKTSKRQTEEAEQEASQNLATYRKTIHELDDAEEREGIAESALNKLHTRHCVSASKGLTFGEIIQVLKPSSSVSAAQEQAPKIELTCLNPPAMNLLEQKRVWDRDEENIAYDFSPYPQRT
ncbi:LOW QUALITY PROTEIN: uncharacterized protein MYH16 [Pluvialis apricaria]